MSTVERMRLDGSTRISLLLERAEAAARNGNADEARRLLKAVLRHEPGNPRALLRLIYVAEDGQASLTYLAQFLDAHPRHPYAQPAIRWVRQRIPTSKPSRIRPTVHRQTQILQRHHRFFYGLAILAMLMGVALIWQLSQSPTAPVQAGARPALFPSLPRSSTPRPLSEIVKVSIPLFTETPTPTSIPTSTPTATPSSAWVPVLGNPQTYNMSCESRSAADLAAFWDISVNELEFLAALGQSDNPHKGFVGDVTALPGSLPPYGYGVYTEPVAATLRNYGLDARPEYNLGLDGLRAELLAGRPVLVWATYGMEPYEPVEWSSSDGQVSTVVPYMHTFLVTGFDERGLSVLDAFDASVQYYSFESFLRAWDLFDQMALIVTGPLP